MTTPTMTVAMMTMTMAAAVVAAAAMVVKVAAGMQRQLPTAWCGAGVRWPEAAKMGIKRNGNIVGMIDRKFYLVKLLHGFIFYVPYSVYQLLLNCHFP